MSFLTWIGGLIGNIVASRVEARLDVYFEKKAKITTIGNEAKELFQELDNAQSESERKAILRKLSSFSDLGRLL